ncbi:MAG TPA: hypothetical protein VLG28_01800 [Acidimicrobiia bacterium]|jgi:hypothetical protein|nr:hypothetical protein [Acidimicrobiia bacterium]
MTSDSTTQQLWGIVRQQPRRLARFEVALATVCLTVPAFLIAFDTWNVRGSISAYWDMSQNQVFYYSLTVAAMMFIVRGARAERHWYSAVLGLALSGVVLFNEQDWQPWHGILAAVFFGGGVLAIVKYSEGPWASKIKRPLLALAVLVLLMWKPLGVISLFWAEWLAMVALAGHFIVHALEEIRDEAPGGGTAHYRAEPQQPQSSRR